MDSKQTMESITRKSGLSEEIVRRVQRAETDTVIEGLKSGKKVNLPGRGSFRSEIRGNLVVGGVATEIRPKFTISSKIKNELSQYGEYKNDKVIYNEEDLPEGILQLEIEDLL